MRGAGGGFEPLVYSNKEGQDSNNATRVSSPTAPQTFKETSPLKATLFYSHKVEITSNVSPLSNKYENRTARPVKFLREDDVGGILGEHK